MSKKPEPFLHAAPAPVMLGDDELSAVSGGAGQGHAYGKDKAHGGPPWLEPGVVNQTNITNIYQIASDVGGSVTQVAGVGEGNAA